jgi:hypothetical protein
MPNTYARGILFGKLVLELCDLSSIDNAKTDYHCDVDFRAKVSSTRTSTQQRHLLSRQGWLSGGYNAINGSVKGPGKSDIGEITGYWHSVMEYRDRKTGGKSVLFDASTAKTVPKTVAPESEQEEYESRRSVYNPRQELAGLLSNPDDQLTEVVGYGPG